MNNSNPYMQDLDYSIERIKFRILDFLCYRFPELFKYNDGRDVKIGTVQDEARLNASF